MRKLMSKLEKTYFNESIGKWTTKELPINPKTQEEADEIYSELDSRMASENIYRDGEATEEEARKTFNYWLRKAKQVKALGFMPTIYGDVFCAEVYGKNHFPKWEETL